MMNKTWFLLLVPLLLENCFIACCLAITTLANLTTDQSALLTLKSHITFDPYNVLANNWSTRTSCCNWIGVTCGIRHQRVTALNLSSKGLNGTIPPQLGNLSFLTSLDIENNNFHGHLPNDLAFLRRLKLINLRSNNFIQQIPSWFHELPNLEILRLSKNGFYGTIPPPLLWKCKQIKELSLSYNNFTGSIPREIGNCTKLQVLYLGDNSFGGEIPQEMGNLANLKILSLRNNGLTGPIPSEIFNISSMETIILALNNLSSSLPEDIMIDHLKTLSVASNQLSGPIPSALWKCRELETLSLSYNHFEGSISREIGNLTAIKALYLGYNNFIGQIPEEIGYLHRMEIFSLVGNKLSGSIPPTLFNISSLEKISLGNNMLTGNCNIWGNIARKIGNSSNLVDLSLGGNELTGAIPPTIGRLQKLLYIRLADNKMQGSIPIEVCLLSRLFKLELSGNELSGPIPTCIGNLTSLNELYLNSNKFTSIIPTTLWSIPYILKLNLSSNSLRGNLPSDIGSMKVVTQLDLSNNQLSGDVPSTIGRLQTLVNLSLAHNSLRGSIHQSLGELISLEFLDLSANHLSGVIPKSFEKLIYLKYLNVSTNSLQGEIPDGGPFAYFSAQSFMLNDGLCGAPRLQVPPCKNNTLQGSRKTIVHLLKYAIAATAVTILVTLLFILMKFRKRKVKHLPQVDLSPLTSRRISRHDLLQATDGFCESNLLGIGSFGYVYRGILSDGVTVAVKVFNLQLEGAFKSFDVECKVLQNIRHRNIIKIISCCSEMDFKALIIELMPNESLEKWLYSHNYCLDILQRLNIMIDVALALEYLHHGYSTTVVHCDLKPSNVLLSEDMVAHVGDFGISKLLREGESSARTMTLATVGYMAPEYGTKGIVSTEGDVYSYGIMLMETFTRKRPTDEIFVGEMSLKRWVSDYLHGTNTILGVVDANLLRRGDDQFVAKEQCISSILRLALYCSKDSPEERINFKVIISRLNRIHSTFLSNTDQKKLEVQTPQIYL